VHRLGDGVGPVVVHQREYAPAEAAAGHAGAVGPGGQRGRDGEVDLRDRDLEVVPHRRVGGGQHRPDTAGVRAGPQRPDHLEDPRVLGDDVARASTQQVVVESGERVGEVVDGEVAQRPQPQ
jgi:hypothetical protein